MVVTFSEPKPYLLHIEDNDGDAYLVVRALRNCGRDLRIGRASDGAEAQAMLEEIEIGRQERPDLILLDLKLPAISGFELLGYIKSKPQLGKIPVVIFTSSDEQKDMGEAKLQGCTAYYVKPIDFTVFRERIVEICEKYLQGSLKLNERGSNGAMLL